jgi:hypothetical protein
MAPIVERAVEVMESRGDMIQLRSKTDDENSSIVPPTQSSLHHMSLPYKAALCLILEEEDGISNSHRGSSAGGLTYHSRSIAHSHAKYTTRGNTKGSRSLLHSSPCTICIRHLVVLILSNECFSTIRYCPIEAMCQSIQNLEDVAISHARECHFCQLACPIVMI